MVFNNPKVNIVTVWFKKKPKHYLVHKMVSKATNALLQSTAIFTEKLDYKPFILLVSFRVYLVSTWTNFWLPKSDTKGELLWRYCINKINRSVFLQFWQHVSLNEFMYHFFESLALDLCASIFVTTPLDLVQ